MRALDRLITEFRTVLDRCRTGGSLRSVVNEDTARYGIIDYAMVHLLYDLTSAVGIFNPFEWICDSTVFLVGGHIDTFDVNVEVRTVIDVDVGKAIGHAQ